VQEKLEDLQEQHEAADHWDESMEQGDNAERDGELLLAEGATFGINGVRVPPPTTMCLPWLSRIGSPFIVGLADGAQLTPEHVVEALYIIVNREKAVECVGMAVRARDALDRAERLADKSPEFYREYLDATMRAAMLRKGFDVAVAKFGESLGVFNWERTAEAIVEYISLSASGFKMVPSAGTGGKKKTMTSNGSAARLPWYVRCARRLLRLR